MAIQLDPKRYDVAIKQLQKLLSEHGIEIQSNTKIIKETQEELGTFKILVADEIQGVIGEFEILKSDLATLDTVLAEYIEANNIKVDTIEGDLADFRLTITNTLDAEYAKIDDLDANYARIDQTNISQAWIEDLLVTGKFLADDFNAATGSFSKYLTGVNIVGDNITAGTISTDRLIIRDEDSDTGILFEINNGIVEQSELSEEQLKRLTLDGKVITAESITADKINVTDLFAQDITSTGDFNMGGNGAFVYDSATDTITIRASSIYMGSGSSIEGTFEETQEQITEVKNATLIEAYDEYATSDSASTEPTEWSTDKPTAGNGIYIWQRRVNVYGNGDLVYGPAVCITGSKGDTGEAAANVRIYSSRGTVFKNNTASTVLSVTVFRGGERITDIDTLQSIYGSTTYLQWSWIKGDDTGTILSTDSRLSNSGFSFTLSPDDVDSNITFQCDLITG